MKWCTAIMVATGCLESALRRTTRHYTTQPHQLNSLRNHSSQTLLVASCSVWLTDAQVQEEHEGTLCCAPKLLAEGILCLLAPSAEQKVLEEAQICAKHTSSEWRCDTHSRNECVTCQLTPSFPSLQLKATLGTNVTLPSRIVAHDASLGSNSSRSNSGAAPPPPPPPPPRVAKVPKQLFGGTLEWAMPDPQDGGSEPLLPDILVGCALFIEACGLGVEGVYRVSPDNRDTPVRPKQRWRASVRATNMSSAPILRHCRLSRLPLRVATVMSKAMCSTL